MITDELTMKLFKKLEVAEKETSPIQSPLKYEYKPDTFWNRTIIKEPVVMYNSQTIANATKNLIGGIFNEEDNALIIDLALKLAFYVVDGDDACFVYDKYLTYENLNLSEKFFGGVLRRKVNLVCNGWFDKWTKFPNSLDPAELELMNYLQQASNNTCISYWGPWFATIILSLGNESLTNGAKNSDAVLSNVAKNIDALFSMLFRLYRGLGFNFPPKNTLLWKESLKRIEIIDLDEPKKNNLYWAMIQAYHNASTPKTVIDLLNLTIMPSLRFKNMELITLIDQFKKMVGCGQCGALIGTLSIGTLHSWDSYIKVAETYLNPQHPLGKDKFWPYAREFDSDVFAEVSYEENYRLCTILAMIIDLNESSTYSYQGNNIGPTYKKLISKKLIKELNQEDFDQCKKLCDLMKKKERDLAAKNNQNIDAKMLTL